MDKRLISTFLILAIGVLLTGCANQPTTGQPGLTAHKVQPMDAILQQLGLSEDQKSQVKAILKDAQMQQKSLNEDKQARLQAVFTADQMTKFVAAHPKRRQMATLFQQLGVNDSQKAQVEAILKDEQTKEKALKEDKQARLQAVLTTEQLANFDAMVQQRHHKLPGNSGTNDQ